MVKMETVFTSEVMNSVDPSAIAKAKEYIKTIKANNLVKINELVASKTRW